MNYPYGQWGPGWGAPPAQPIVFIPSPGTPNTNPPPQQFTSWEEVHKRAKIEMKREAKLKRKWDEEAKKKKDGEKKPEIKRPAVPLLEGLIFTVLLSPIIGLPTLKLYQALFQMWGVALGAH
jgi:hypothetical protein